MAPFMWSRPGVGSDPVVRAESGSRGSGVDSVGVAGGSSRTHTQAQARAQAPVGAASVLTSAPSRADVRCSEEEEAAAAAGRFLAAPWAHESREAAGLEGPRAREANESRGETGERGERGGLEEGSSPLEGRERRGAEVGGGREGFHSPHASRGATSAGHRGCHVSASASPDAVSSRGDGTEDILSEGGWEGLTSAEAREAGTLTSAEASEQDGELGIELSEAGREASAFNPRGPRGSGSNQEVPGGNENASPLPPPPPSSVLIRGPQGSLFVGTEFWKHSKAAMAQDLAGAHGDGDSDGAADSARAHESARPATSADDSFAPSQAPETASRGAADATPRNAEMGAASTLPAHHPSLSQPATPVPLCVTPPDPTFHHCPAPPLLSPHSPSRPFPEPLDLGPPALSLPLPRGAGDAAYLQAAKGAFGEGSWEGGLCPRVDSETIDPSLCLSPVSDAACWAQLLLAEETSFVFVPADEEDDEFETERKDKLTGIHIVLPPPPPPPAPTLDDLRGIAPLFDPRLIAAFKRKKGAFICLLLFGGFLYAVSFIAGIIDSQEGYDTLGLDVLSQAMLSSSNTWVALANLVLYLTMDLIGLAGALLEYSPVLSLYIVVEIIITAVSAMEALRPLLLYRFLVIIFAYEVRYGALLLMEAERHLRSRLMGNPLPPPNMNTWLARLRFFPGSLSDMKSHVIFLYQHPFTVLRGWSLRRVARTPASAIPRSVSSQV